MVDIFGNPEAGDPQQSPIGAGNTTQGFGQQQTPGLDFGDMGAWGKMGVVSQGIGAFSSLASIYAGFKAMKLEKSKFKFQKDAWNKNYNNQVKDYENNLKDRWAARSASATAHGRSFESMGSYVTDRKLTGTAPAPATGG